MSFFTIKGKSTSENNISSNDSSTKSLNINKFSSNNEINNDYKINDNMNYISPTNPTNESENTENNIQIGFLYKNYLKFIILILYLINF